MWSVVKEYELMVSTHMYCTAYIHSVLCEMAVHTNSQCSLKSHVITESICLSGVTVTVKS